MATMEDESMSVEEEVMETIDELHHLVAKLDRLRLIASEEEDMTSQAIGRAFAEIQEVKKSLSSTHSDWMQFAYDSTPAKEIRLGGGRYLEKRQSQSKRGWRHDDLAALVAHRIYDYAIDMDTGEISKTPEEMIRELVRYAGISYWRKGELARLDIDPDQFCELGEAKDTITVRN